jgi:phenylacetate-coenzyme A ligase PaaK-like adenylate-forming protein
VPYYREAMRRLGLHPAEFRSAGDLRLPLLERGDLQRDPEYFVSRAQPLERYLPLASGGSTGRPITVFHDAGMVFQGAAQRARMGTVIAKLTGRPLRYRRAMIVPATSSSGVMHGAYARGGLGSPSLRVVSQRFSMHAKTTSAVRPTSRGSR